RRVQERGRSPRRHHLSHAKARAPYVSPALSLRAQARRSTPPASGGRNLTCFALTLCHFTSVYRLRPDAKSSCFRRRSSSTARACSATRLPVLLRLSACFCASLCRVSSIAASASTLTAIQRADGRRRPIDGVQSRG